MRRGRPDRQIQECDIDRLSFPGTWNVLFRRHGMDVALGAGGIRHKRLVRLVAWRVRVIAFKILHPGQSSGLVSAASDPSPCQQ